MSSRGNPNREKFIHTQPNMLEDSRYLLRPHTQKHFSIDTTEYSRYLSNRPYTKKHTSGNLNAEEYLPHSSNYSYARYNDVDSTANLSHSSRYSGTGVNRHTFASECNKHSRLETHSLCYPQTERYTPTDVNAIDDMTYSSQFYHSEGNECFRLETHSSRYPNAERYTPTEVNVRDDMTYSSHFSHLERNECSRLETHSSCYLHTERYTPTELNAMDDMTYSSHFGRNEYSRLQTFEDSIALSRKYMSSNLNIADDLEYTPFYPHKEQNVPIELGTDRDYTYLSHNLHKKIKMNTKADDVRDPIYPTYLEKKNPTGMEVLEDSAFLPLHHYTRKISAFVPLPHKDKLTDLDNEDHPTLYRHADRDPSNLDDQFLDNPQSGRYMFIHQDPVIAPTIAKANLQHSNNTPTSQHSNNTPTSQPLKRKLGNAEFYEADHIDGPRLSKMKFPCKLCPREFRMRFPLHMHMIDKHNINDGKFPLKKKGKTKTVWKELMQMKKEARFELRQIKRDEKLELRRMKLEGESYEPNPSKRKKCELCNKSVRTMYRHLHGVHNPKFTQNIPNGTSVKDSQKRKGHQ